MSATDENGPAPIDASTKRPAASVLIVDDDKWTTRAVAAALRDSGAFIVLDPKHSGEAAVEAYAAHRPDLVLMDVNMPPGMSGVDATREIIGLDPKATIVLLTTVAPGPGLARALEAGALAAVNKSASDAELIRVAEAALEGDSPVLLRNLAEDILVSGDSVPDVPDQAPALTEAELAVLRHICEGLDYSDIAERQFVTLHTVKSHARNLRIKLGAKNLAQVVIRAMQYKFHSPE